MNIQNHFQILFPYKKNFRYHYLIICNFSDMIRNSRRLFGKQYGLSFFAVDRPAAKTVTDLLKYYDKNEGLSNGVDLF